MVTAPSAQTEEAVVINAINRINILFMFQSVQTVLAQPVLDVVGDLLVVQLLEHEVKATLPKARLVWPKARLPRLKSEI